MYLSKSFAQPRKDEWTDQLLLWLHWISVAATTQLQPGQKGLATRGPGAALRALLFGEGEREPLGEIGERVLKDTAVGGAYKIKDRTHAVGRDQEKQALLNAPFGALSCPISALAKRQCWS